MVLASKTLTKHGFIGCVYARSGQKDSPCSHRAYSPTQAYLTCQVLPSAVKMAKLCLRITEQKVGQRVNGWPGEFLLIRCLKEVKKPAAQISEELRR